MLRLLALLAALQNPVAPAQPDTAHVVIVATTDVHGHVLGWDYVKGQEGPGGLSRAATIVETLRAQYPGQVVLVDAGDLLQGTLLATYYGREHPQRPHPMVDAFNALQYDAATPGNHDFDFGADLLLQAFNDATYRYVSANIVRGRGGDTLVFPAVTVVTRNGVKIAFTGLTTPGVMVWDQAQLSAARIRVRSLAAAAPQALSALAAAGADFKVALVHSGLSEPSAYDTAGVGAENDAAVLATLPDKPDLVVVGHTHRQVRDTVINGVHFVQPRNFALSLSVVHVWFRRSAGHWQVDHMRADLIPLATVPELPRFQRRATQAHDLARAWGETALGSAGAGFDARLARAQDSPLLDFINEVQRRAAGADLSAAAVFDTGAGLPEGEVRVRDVFGIYPYENTLRAVRISGQQLREYLEQSARYYRTYAPGQPIVNDSVPGYNYDVVTGVLYNLDLTRPAGQRVRGLSYRGRLVQATDSFTLALNSYRQAGAGGFTMLRGARVVYDRGEDIRQLLVSELRRARVLDARNYYVPSWSILAPGRDAALAAFTPQAPQVGVADSTMLRVLAINDLHGALAPRVWPWSNNRPVGGVAALKTWMDSLARQCGCTSIRLDGGDEMQGTPMSNFAFGRPVIGALNRLGIDAAAIGNHEFDWGVDTLIAREHDARYPFLSANITDSIGSARPDWALPYTVLAKGGLKIAVIGLTTTSTPTTTRPANVHGLAFGDEALAVNRVLARARAGADFVILLAHEGAFCDSGGPCHGEIVDLARRLDSAAVDLIVSGHTHTLVNTVVHGIPIVQARSNGTTIAVVDFVRVGGTRREVRVRIETPWADQVAADTGEAAVVATAQRMVDTISARPIVALRGGLQRQGDEYTLGRLIADAERNIVKTDVAIINNGGIRADLPAGMLTYGDVFQVEPFQNRLVRLTVSGDVLLAALEHMLAGERPDGHVAGIEVWYDPQKPAGRRITKTRLTDGKGINGGHKYTLAVPDFLATGGSGFAMLTSAPAQDAGIVDVDALITYLSVLPKPVAPPDDVRLHAKGGR